MPDDDYQSAGAEIVGGSPDVWRLADMIVKVKEPTEKEYRYFRPDLLLFTYLHLAPLNELTSALVDSKVTGIAYETVRDRANTLPLFRSARSTLPRSMAAAASSLVVFPASLRPASASSAAASSAPMQQRWPSAWARRSPCSTTT